MCRECYCGIFTKKSSSKCLKQECSKKRSEKLRFGGSLVSESGQGLGSMTVLNLEPSPF